MIESPFRGPLLFLRMNKIKFTIFRPSGNDTALVSGIIRDPKARKIIADTIQEVYRNVEQVGFINSDPKTAELVMTGGEFCGNATSSAAYQILRGEPGEIKIKVSGVKRMLRAGVTQSGEGFSQMPVLPDPSYIREDSSRPGNFFVFMEGITHYVDFDFQPIVGLTIDQIKARGRQQMKEKGIDQGSACGIIYAEHSTKGWIINPVVYVKDADTLYFETACGSGTTALGLVLAKTRGKAVEKISVIQPSGLTIKVSVEFDGILYGYVQIQSNIQELGQGMLRGNSSDSLPKPSQLPLNFKVHAH